MATTFDINGFKSALVNGGARPNQFQVTLTYPNYVFNSTRQASFLVTNAELPGSSIPPATVFYRGRQVNLAGDRSFAPWTATVINDTSFTVRTSIEQWMNGMDSLLTKRGRTTPLGPNGYSADLYVDQLDRNGAILKRYILLDAFPVDLSPVTLDYQANDQLSQFQVQFVYQTFTTTNVPVSVV